MSSSAAPPLGSLGSRKRSSWPSQTLSQKLSRTLLLLLFLSRGSCLLSLLCGVSPIQSTAPRQHHRSQPCSCVHLLNLLLLLCLCLLSLLCVAKLQSTPPRQHHSHQGVHLLKRPISTNLQQNLSKCCFSLLLSVVFVVLCFGENHWAEDRTANSSGFLYRSARPARGTQVVAHHGVHAHALQRPGWCASCLVLELGDQLFKLQPRRRLRARSSQGARWCASCGAWCLSSVTSYSSSSLVDAKEPVLPRARDGAPRAVLGA